MMSGLLLIRVGVEIIVEAIKSPNAAASVNMPVAFP